MSWVFRRPFDFRHRKLSSAVRSLFGEPPVSGTLDVTLANVTSSAQGDVNNSGSVNVTIGDVTLTGQGNVNNDAALNLTLADVTLAGQGAVGADATLNETLDNVTLAGQGDVNNSGTLNVTLGDVTLAGQGAAGTNATVNLTLADVTLAGQGNVNNSGSANITIGDVTLVGSGIVGSAGSGSPIMVDADDIYSNGLEAALALNVSVSNNGGLGGLTVTVRIRDGSTTNSYLDFNDMTFKTSGHTTLQSALTDLTGGFYTKLLDMTAITNLPGNNLALEYRITGSINAVAMASIARIDLAVLNSLSALTVGKFLALKDA